MAKLSFAVTTPGTVASDADMTGFLQRIRAGDLPSIADLASFERILFEAQTLMVHHLKSATKGDDISVKRWHPRKGMQDLPNNVLCLRFGYHWSFGASTCAL